MTIFGIQSQFSETLVSLASLFHSTVFLLKAFRWSQFQFDSLNWNFISLVMPKIAIAKDPIRH